MVRKPTVTYITKCMASVASRFRGFIRGTEPIPIDPIDKCLQDNRLEQLKFRIVQKFDYRGH